MYQNPEHNISPEKKTTVTIQCCYRDAPAQYFNAYYWHSDKFITDCFSLSFL